MFPSSKFMLLLAEFGQSVLFALAFTGLVRFGFILFGSKLPPEAAGSLFFATSLVAGTASVLLFARSQKLAQTPVAASPALANHQ